MTAKYETASYWKLAERCTYEQGADPDTAMQWAEKWYISGGTIAEVLTKVRDFCGVSPEDDALLLDSCDEPGRVDVQLLETDEGDPASYAEIEEWKEGGRHLWSVIYSFRIERVTREPVTLTGDA